jgi:beta-glucanase (GH16 family)
MTKHLGFLWVVTTITTACVSPSSSQGLPNGLLPLVPTSDCGVQRLDNDWVCMWADEFNGDNLNEDHWNVEINTDGGGNQEAQAYRRENIQVQDGLLTITAKKESVLGKNYTSGRINSRYKVNTRYGRVSFRAKVPGGRGTWAAVWMLPLFNLFGQWPRSGEIDMLEYVGYDQNRVFSALHTERFNHTKNNNLVMSQLVAGVEDDFFDFDMIWVPGEIRMLVDGRQYGLYRYSPQFNQEAPYHQVFPFYEEFYFIINLAIGGSWGGVQGIDDSIFPVQFQLDYLRLYQFDYATVDQTDPLKPTGLAKSQLANTIHWQRGVDDTQVSHYAIYLDDVLYREVSPNQFTFVGLVNQQTYRVQIQAIDFVGRVSPLSEPFDLTFGG